MHDSFIFLSFVIACQESLEDRCAREAKEFTSAKNCPSKIEKNINIDSLTFERETRIGYYIITIL